MKISVAGAGYVGLSNAVLLAKKHEVTIVDILKEKVDLINNNQCPIVDNDIEKTMSNDNLNLKATTDKYEGYKNAEYVIIATPTNYDPEENHFNTRSVESVIATVLAINPNALMVIVPLSQGLYRRCERDV